MYTFIRAASDAIVRYVEQALDADVVLGPLFIAGGGVMRVVLNTPREATTLGVQGLSVWLYQVIRDDQRLNAAPDRVRQDDPVTGQAHHALRRPPLPVRLRFLMTPLVQNTAASPNAGPQREQELVGKVLQIFYDHPTLRGADLQATPLEGASTALHVRLEPLTLEEITRVWHALGESYQLSVSYEVTVVPIHAAVAPSPVQPVQVALPEYAAIVGEEP